MGTTVKNVRAKFTCTSVETVIDSPGFAYNFKFSPVISGSEENKEFYKWTPSGSIELRNIKSELFQVGEQYYLDFTLFEEAKE